MEFAKKEDLQFEPGTKWGYSNTGMLVAGKVIEAATKQSYFDYVRDHIYKPAGMLNTDAYELDYVTPNLAVGYQREQTSSGPRWRNNIFMHVIRGGPAGGGYSTVEDLLRFDVALRSGKLVGKKYVDLLTTPKPELQSPAYGYRLRRFRRWQDRGPLRRISWDQFQPGHLPNERLHHGGAFQLRWRLDAGRSQGAHAAGSVASLGDSPTHKEVTPRTALFPLSDPTSGSGLPYLQWCGDYQGAERESHANDRLSSQVPSHPPAPRGNEAGARGQSGQRRGASQRAANSRRTPRRSATPRGGQGPQVASFGRAPNGELHGHSAKDLRARILKHMNAWGKRANVLFTQTNGTGQVRIARLDSPPDDAGYWSWIGTEILEIDEDEPTLNLEGFTMRTSEAEFRRVVRHEAGHTLGFEHEHMRRDLVRRIDRRKAIAFYDMDQGWTPEEVEEQVLTPLKQVSIMGTAESDPHSIMCYQIPAAITKDGKAIVGGRDINAKDFAFAASIYPKRVRR